MPAMTITQASLALGISQDVIRRRLRSGEIPGERIPAAGGFRWMVNVDDAGKNGQHHNDVDGQHHDGNDLVEILKGQVQDLRDMLDTRTREISELHQIIGARALNPGSRPWWKFWLTP